MIKFLLDQGLPRSAALLKAFANFVSLPARRIWLDYDRDVDVLYVHFEDQPMSTHSEMTEEGIILDYRNEKVSSQ